MRLSSAQLAAVSTAAAIFPDDANVQPLEEFMGSVLALSLVEKASLMPDPDPTGVGSINISEFTKARDLLIRDEGKVPSYVAYKPKGQAQYFISGIATYLRTFRSGADSAFLMRIKSRDSVRSALRRLKQGHDLELVAAAVFANACDYGQATAGSGDQGIDAVAWKELLSIDDVFMDGLAGSELIRPGNRVYFVASSKAMMDAGGAAPLKLISPAHIRELVGSWVIQRSSVGAWTSLGLQMLTPLQLVLVTTYRLSAEAQQDCHKLGVQVWGLPELTYLICKHAPPEVFNGPSGDFVQTAFNAWWRAKKTSRLSRTASLVSVP